MATNRQPKNIFEQIVFGQEITNDNIVALADNLAVVNSKLDALLGIFTPTESEPTTSGAENVEQ